MNNEFNYEIIKEGPTLEQLKGNYELKLNLISFNGKTPRLDLRKWNTEKGTMLKGISITKEQAERLLKELPNMIELMN